MTDGTLRLLIEHDQEPWSPEFAGHLRVSSLQTGVFAGPVGSTIGQHRFHEGIIVREEQCNAALYTPQYGLFELKAGALDDPVNMVALWMIGYEDDPTHSAEICICEIFGRDVGPLQTRVGMGVHPSEILASQTTSPPRRLASTLAPRTPTRRSGPRTMSPFTSTGG